MRYQRCIIAVVLSHQLLRSFPIALYIVIHFSAGYSEDSDYTSDLNYPVTGQGANSSASQFRTAANQLATPQRSLETSRENSYERDDHQVLINGAKRKRKKKNNIFPGTQSSRYMCIVARSLAHKLFDISFPFNYSAAMTVRDDKLDRHSSN